jgi:hypothetical protein
MTADVTPVELRQLETICRKLAGRPGAAPAADGQRDGTNDDTKKDPP